MKKLRPIRPAIRLPEIPPEPPKPKMAKLKLNIELVRIDPFTRGIARLRVQMTTESENNVGNGTADLMRLCKVNRLGSQHLGIKITEGPIEFPLIAVGGAGLSSDIKGWKLGEDGIVTGGISLIMCLGLGGDVWTLPRIITADWVRERVVWDDGVPEDAEGGSGAEGEIA